MGATLAVTIVNNSSLDLNCYVQCNAYVMNYVGPTSPLIAAGSAINVSWEKDNGAIGAAWAHNGSVDLAFWVTPGHVTVNGPMTTRWPGFHIMSVDYGDSLGSDWGLTGVNGQAAPAFPVPLPFPIPQISASDPLNAVAFIKIG